MATPRVAKISFNKDVLSSVQTMLFCLFLQVIHGLLDRTMQLLEVPYTEDKTSLHGYYLKAHEGIFIIYLLLRN